MSKQLNVDLHVNADTSSAQTNLKQLFTSLEQISSVTPKFGMAISEDMAKAKQSAMDLKVHLENAMNVKTGNLDLDKLSLSLQASNQSLTGLTSNLLKAGTTGEKSFFQIQSAITNAGVKLNQTQGLLSSFLTTLKNTAKWQLSSTLLHGFMSALQGSIQYAKDLDESLNNIRIVTQASSDEMAKFAEKANKAAQSLNTTTTAYTDAALIYYQQGLNDKEVEARTNVTIKMANAAGKSAQEVSQQLTAVWNNFAEGSQNLEYYADVMTALGAATASSTDEIAEGLQKFAAVANTVGLSYEYAAAALATVTATTRQSADVVGTAFKTLFARIQDLELGETLDDGTTLGKYSKALATIGINIKDTSGQMKDMNTILDEMGAKWDTLSKDAQVAVAQAVGGTRQYTQLIALMDNWDFMQKNISVAEDSEGTLQKQADIYGESWEAASKRIKAALEELYTKLIPTDFIIDFTDGLSKVINVIDNLVGSFGGLPNILLLISNILMSKFAPQLAETLDIGIMKVTNLFSGINSFGDAVKTAGEKIKTSFVGAIQTAAAQGAKFAEAATVITSSSSKNVQQKAYDNYNLKNAQNNLQQENTQNNFSKLEDDTVSSSMKSQIQDLTQIDNLTSLIAQNRKLMTAAQQESLKKDTDLLLILSQQKAEEEAKLSLMRQEADAMVLEQNYTKPKISTNDNGTGRAEIATSATAIPTADAESLNTTLTECMGTITDMNVSFDQQGNKIRLIVNGAESETAALEQVQEIQQQSLANYSGIEQLNKSINLILADGATTEEEKRGKILKVIQSLQEEGKISASVAQKYKDIVQDTNNWNKTTKTGISTIKGLKQQMNQSSTAARDFAKAAGVGSDALAKGKEAGHNLAEATNKADQAGSRYTATLNSIKEKISAIGNQKLSIGTTITQAIQGVSQLGMGIAAIGNSWKTLTSSDASFFDKLSAGAMGLSMALSTATAVSSLFNMVQRSSTTLSMLRVLAMKAETDGDKKQIAEKLALIAVKKLHLSQDQQQLIQDALLNKMKEKGGKLTLAETFATIKSTLAKAGETGATEGATGAQWSLNAAMEASPIGAIITLVMALIAVLALLVIGIVALINKESAEEKAAKNAAAAAEHLKEAYNETKQAYEDLITSISDYQNAKNALDELTKGTTEWRDQIRAVNEQAMELITTYSELKDYAKYNDDGILEISQEGLDMVQEQQSQEVDRAYTRSLMGQASALDTKQRLDVSKVQEENHLDFWEGAGTVVKSMMEDTLAGATAGMLVGGAAGGPAGAAGGGLVGALEGATFGLFHGISNIFNANQQSDDAIQAAVDDYVAHNGQFDGVIDDAGLAKELHVSEDLIPAIRELGDSAIKAGDAMKAAAEESTRAILDHNEVVQDSLYSDDVSVFTSDTYQKEYERVYEDELAAAMDGSATSMENYAEAMGLTDLKNYKVTSSKDGTFEYEYIDDNGDPQKKTVTAAEIASVNATTAAEIKANEKGEEVAKILNKVDASTEKQLLALKTGDTSNLNTSELNKGMNLDNLSVKEIAALDIDGIGGKKFVRGEGELFGHIETDEEYKARAQEELQKKADEAKEKIVTDTGTKYSTQVKNIVEGIVNDADGAFSKVSQGTISAYSDVLGQISQNAGSSVASQFNTAMEGVLADHAGEEEEILSAAAGIDWTKGADAVNEFYSNLTAMGIKIDQTDDDWERMVAAVQRMNVSVLNHDIDALREKVKNIADLTKDIKIGSVISDEDYNKLIGYNSELADMFALTADGYEYIGTQDLSTIAGDMAKSAYEDALQQNEDARNAYSQFYDSWGWTDENGERVSVADRAGQYANGTRSATEMANTFNAMAEDEDADGAISALGYDKGELQNYADMISEGTEGVHHYTEEQIEAATAELRQYYADIAALQTQIENGDFSDERAGELYATSMLNAASSIEELNSAWSKVNETLGEADYNLYASALIGMGSEYSNCAEEIDKYREALNSSNEAQLKQAESALQASIMAGGAAEKYGLNADTLETQAEQIQAAYAKEHDGAEMSAQSAMRLAIKNERMNKGVAALNQNFSKWNKTLTTADHESQDYAEALNEANEALADLTGALDAAAIPADFLDNTTADGAKHLQLLGKAAQGDTKAINQLGMELAQSQLSALEFSDTIAHMHGTSQGGGWFDDNGNLLENYVTPEQFDKAKQIVTEGVDALKSKLGELEEGQDVGEILGDDWVASLNDMAYATNMSVEEMQSYLNELGIDAEVETKTKKLERNVPVYTTEMTNIKKDEKGTVTSYDMTTRVTGHKLMQEEVEYAALKTDGKGGITFTGSRSAGGVSKNSTGGSNGSGSGSGGGSGNTPKKVNDEKDRYHEVTKKLDDLGRAYDRLGTHKEHAFGKSYINIIKEETKALDDQINTLNNKLEEAKKYYKEDLAAIQKYGAIVDENGNITNYNEIIEKYVGLYNANAIDDDAYSEMKEALSRFEETADTIEDIKNEIEDKVYEQVALEIERIDTEVNMDIEINDEDLQWLEYLLTKIENQSFNTAKQIAIMGYQTDEIFSKINTYEAGLKSLEEQAAQNLANGLFTETGGWDSDMKNKAKEFTDGLMEANKTLLEYKQTLTEKFQEAIDEANETFDNQIGRFDNYTSILQSYTEILHLTGKTLKNSDLIIKFGNQQVEVARNQLVALKAQQNTLYASLAEAQQKLADAQARGDQDSIRHWTDEVNNITIQAEEGKANLISSFQEAMSTAADIFASTVEQFIAQANAALSIYDTLEEAQDAYDRAKERSEWFLDNATQAYELSKLMRNINQQIDKTDNLGAQIKLRDLLDEINDIQKNNVKISQDDLDILNAKYELRLAEIALEEAQNAKDTVKLSRNAEGGWGYVYTANQDTTDQAIQDYEDKAYDLEKLIKEKITNISDAILENKQDTLDRIASLNIESFENEQDYWDAVNKIREEGLAKDLYLRDSLERMLAEGNLSYADILLKDFENADSLEEGRSIFEQVTQELLDNASNAFAEYRKQTDVLLESLGFDSTEDLLAWLQSSADDIVNGANGLSSKLIQYSEESQDAIKKAADAIADYEKQYNESINNMIDTSEDMIKTVTEMLRRFGLLDDNATLADFWDGDIAEDHSIPAQYDTGGYTGEWGQAGKLAVLHEKELVLNKNETKDLLKIMDIIKDQALKDRIKEANDLLEISRNSIDNLFKAMGNNELEQNVHITAEFPSVTDHNEIEEAFNNLINSASQYINRY